MNYRLLLALLSNIFLNNTLIAQIPGEKKPLSFIQNKLDEVENLYAQAKYDESISIGRVALNGLTKVNNFEQKKYAFKLYLNLASNYYNLFKGDSTLFYFNQANQLLRKNPDLTKAIPDYVASHWDSQGLFYARNANYTQAVQFLQKGLFLCKEYHLTSYERTFLNNLANTYDWMSEYHKAFHIYQKILTIGIPKSNDGLQITSSIGWNALRRKDYKMAETFFKKSISLNSQLNNKQLNINKLLAKTLLEFDLGVCYSLSKSYQKSDLLLNKVITFFQEQNIKRAKYLSLTYLQKAKNKYQLGEMQLALNDVQKGLQSIVLEFDDNSFNENPKLSQTILDNRTLFQLLTLKGEILNNIYQKKPNISLLEKCVRCFYTAILLAEKHRKTVDYQDDKLRFNQDNKLVFEKAIALCYQLYQSKPSLANANLFLRTIESTKAIALNDKMALDQVKASPKAFLIQEQEQKELRHNAALKQTTFDENIHPRKRDSLKTLITESELRLYELNNALVEYMPQRRTSNFTVDLSIKEIVANLKPSSAYISYTITSNLEIYVLAVNHHKILLKKLNLPSDFTKQIQQLIFLLRYNPTLFEYEGHSQALALYNVLIKPVDIIFEDTKCMMISRDGILNYLPFEVLETSKKKGDYLIRHFAISYQYNALSYLLKQDRNQGNAYKLMTLAPFTKQQIIEGDTLAALPASTKKENEDILVDSQATKNRFIQIANQYEIFHLKCHSVTDPRTYDNSYVYFNTSSSSWKLGFHEILALPLKKCQLIILASCNSANGFTKPHEGVMSLCYAFYKAGCKAVLAAQWQAHDRSSEFITNKFYGYLKDGETKDIALQKAKIDFLNEPIGMELNHPFYWANFTITGNINPIESASIPSIYIVCLLIGFLLLGVIFLRIHIVKIL